MTDFENAAPNVPKVTVKNPVHKVKWSLHLNGALVEVTSKDLEKAKGYVRWVGTPDFSAGKFIGVELLEPIGRNNGTIQNKQYFVCSENHGVFVRGSCLTLLKKPRRRSIVERTNLHTQKKKEAIAQRHAERMLRLQKVDYAKRMAMRARGIKMRESLGVRHLCTPTRPRNSRNFRKKMARQRSGRKTKKKMEFGHKQAPKRNILTEIVEQEEKGKDEEDDLNIDLSDLPPLPILPLNEECESKEDADDLKSPVEFTAQMLQKTFSQVLEMTQYLNYAKQAQWLLNGYWTDIFGPDEVLREKLWKIVNLMAESDKRMSTTGNGLPMVEALAFFARVNNERLHCIDATEDTFRTMDFNNNGKISLIKFFLYAFEINSPPPNFRMSNQEKDLKNQRIAEKQLAAANQSLAESKICAETAKALERKVRDATNVVMATAQAKMEALKAAEDAEQTLKDSLQALQKEEEAKSAQVLELTKLSMDDSVGLVVKNKALLKLQALENEDPLLLRKAKLTQTFSMKGAKRARKTAQTKAKKAKEAEGVMQASKDAAADAAASADTCLKKALEGFSLAEDMMSGVRAPLCCNGNGSDWWTVRVAMAASGEDEVLELDDNHVAEVEVKRTIRRRGGGRRRRRSQRRRSSFDVESKREDMEKRSQADIISLMEERALELAKQKLGEAQQKAEEFERKYAREMEIRKQLHNKVVDMQGKIRVFCRIRPVLSLEKNKAGSMNVCSYTSNDRLHLAREKGEPSNFKFNSVFQPDSTQTQVFHELQPFITSALDGYNVCIFAYGQTGSGKTFTMEGSVSNPGVYVRTMRELFAVQKRTKGTRDSTFEVSIVEIYNEKLRDLLVQGSNATALKITSDEEGNSDIQGLTREQVHDEGEVQALLTRGSRVRQTGGHDANATSSRSHLIFTIYCNAADVAKGTVTTAKLNLIDLAGSERLSKTNATGHMLTEAKNINKSLSALGNVICSLGKSKHVPYRDSKLTFALRDCLGGKSKVLMFVNCSPTQASAGETLCSLRFANRCSKTALGKAEKNVDTKANAMLKRENQRLRNRIVELEEQLCKALER